jgi:excisionase family DNA binding protein
MLKAIAPTVDSHRPIVDRRLYSVAEVMALTNLSQAHIYRCMNDGRLRSIKEGRRRLIRAKDLETFINALSGDRDD